MNYIKLDGIGEYHDRGMSHSRSSHKNDDTSVTNFFFKHCHLISRHSRLLNLTKSFQAMFNNTISYFFRKYHLQIKITIEQVQITIIQNRLLTRRTRDFPMLKS